MAEHLTAEQIDDVKFLMETMYWPFYPFCPIKRDQEIAFAWDGEKGKRKVYIGNLLSFLGGETKLSELQSIDYESSAAVVRDGWEVD